MDPGPAAMKNQDQLGKAKRDPGEGKVSSGRRIGVESTRNLRIIAGETKGVDQK